MVIPRSPRENVARFNVHCRCKKKSKSIRIFSVKYNLHNKFSMHQIRLIKNLIYLVVCCFLSFLYYLYYVFFNINNGWDFLCLCSDRLLKPVSVNILYSRTSRTVQFKHSSQTHVFKELCSHRFILICILSCLFLTGL